MVAPHKLDQHTATAYVAKTTSTDDDIIQQELKRRNDFDKTFRKSLLKLATRIRVKGDSGADQRKRNDTELHRLTAKVTREAMFRHAFDKQHPRIYPTPEARRKAYESLHPQTWRLPSVQPPPDVAE